MSRIYEALLQAELDRLTPEEQKTYARDPDTFPAIAALISRTAPQQTSAHDVTELQQHHQSAGPLRVERRQWQPRLDKLPTLQARSAFTEQFRSLRSRMYEYRGFHKLKTVLISSGMPQEGKTFVAANLALSLARYRNNRVLLIDADLRRNSLHTLLGTSAAPGLSLYLSGDATELDVMQRCDLHVDSDESHASPLSNITFIPGGAGGDSAADLSGNSRFAELIRYVAPHFDWIIVDSSPVNVVSDAVNLVPACDGVLLVTRGGQTSYKTAQRAQKEFGSANLLGVVLNAAADVPHQSYYGYGTEPEL